MERTNDTPTGEHLRRPTQLAAHRKPFSNSLSLLLSLMTSEFLITSILFFRLSARTPRIDRGTRRDRR